MKEIMRTAILRAIGHIIIWFTCRDVTAYKPIKTNYLSRNFLSLLKQEPNKVYFLSQETIKSLS